MISQFFVMMFHYRALIFEVYSLLVERHTSFCRDLKSVDTPWRVDFNMPRSKTGSNRAQHTATCLGEFLFVLGFSIYLCGFGGLIYSQIANLDSQIANLDPQIAILFGLFLELPKKRLNLDPVFITKNILKMQATLWIHP